MSAVTGYFRFVKYLQITVTDRFYWLRLTVCSMKQHYCKLQLQTIMTNCRLYRPVIFMKQTPKRYPINFNFNYCSLSLIIPQISACSIPSPSQTKVAPSGKQQRASKWSCSKCRKYQIHMGKRWIFWTLGEFCHSFGASSTSEWDWNCLESDKIYFASLR